jgi:hypothetical protein
MALRDVVDVQISLAISGLTRVGFGTLLFISEYSSAPHARVIEFASADEANANSDVNANVKLAVSRFFGGDLRSPRVKVGYKLATETWTEALDACQEFDGDWYAFALDTDDDDDIEDGAAWAQPRPKLYIAKTADADVLDPTDDSCIASTLLAAEYDSVGLIWSTSATSDYPDMAWAGGLLPETPGSITWAFKRVPGIPADPFTGAEITALESKRVTRLENIQGTSRTIGGYTSRPGFFIDIRRGLDYHAQRTAEDLFILLTTEKKVPGDDRGSLAVEQVIRRRLLQSVEEGIFINDDFLDVFVPNFNQRDPIDREQRFLQGVTFQANLQGAIHKISVRGTVRA